MNDLCSISMYHPFHVCYIYFLLGFFCFTRCSVQLAKIHIFFYILQVGGTIGQQKENIFTLVQKCPTLYFNILKKKVYYISYINII